MWTPQETKERIDNRSLLADSVFDALDSEAYLDARDHSGSFDADWARAFKAVEAAWKEWPDRTQHKAALDAAREAAFKRTFAASHGYHDLAAAVSDDFEIICKRALLGIESPFITGLAEAYDSQRLPQ